MHTSDNFLDMHNDGINLFTLSNRHEMCSFESFSSSGCLTWLCFVMPLPIGTGGIMFSGCPSVRPSREIPSFHLYMGSLVHPTNHDRFEACPEILHADVSWPPSELIRLWSRSVDFPPFGTNLTGQIWGFRAFPRERVEGFMAWNFACWCILTTFRTD